MLKQTWDSSNHQLVNSCRSNARVVYILLKTVSPYLINRQPKTIILPNTYSQSSWYLIASSTPILLSKHLLLLLLLLFLLLNKTTAPAEKCPKTIPNNRAINTALLLGIPVFLPQECPQVIAGDVVFLSISCGFFVSRRAYLSSRLPIFQLFVNP